MCKMIISRVMMFAALSSLVFNFGCSKPSIASNSANTLKTNTTNDHSDSLFTNTIKVALSTELKQDVRGFTVTFSKKVTDGDLAQFIFTSGDRSYEGDAYLTHDSSGGWIIKNKGFQKVDKTAPLTHMELSGQTVSGDKYAILSGTVNDDRINYVLINTFDGVLAKVMLTSSHTYAFVRDGYEKGAKKVEGYSSSDNLVFQLK